MVPLVYHPSHNREASSGELFEEIGCGWIGNYDADYFKDRPPALRTASPRRAKDHSGSLNAQFWQLCLAE